MISDLIEHAALNHGYQEIATSMQAVDVTVVGCDPTPPDFEHIANAHEMPFWRCGDDAKAIASALSSATSHDGPTLIEIRAPNVARPGYETSPQ